MSDQTIPTAPRIAENAPYRFKFALFSLKGRLIRQHFWISYLIITAIGVVLSLLPVINIFSGIATLCGKLAINTKRLHDMGYSGWFAAIPLAAGIIATISCVAAVSIFFFHMIALEEDISLIPPETFGAAIALCFLTAIILQLVNLAFLLWIGITNSQPGTNQYGPNPKGI